MAESEYPETRSRKPMTASVRRRKARTFVPPLTISRKNFLKNGSDEWFRAVIYTTALAVERLMACRTAFGRSLGLTGSQFVVLIGTAYRQGESGVTIRDLSDHVALAQPHVTAEVSVLVRKGLLLKRAHDSDRRSVLVSLAPKGEQAVMQVAAMVRKLNDLLFTDISASDLETVSAVMNKLILNSEYALAEVRRLRSEKRG
jgi:DNA-binding MarR family transcriptional regulator